jgi:aliphatic nitrilase
MGDVYPKFKAAGVMAAPVFLDRERTTEKACDLISEAGAQGAELIVFPEVYIPAYPYWAWLGTPTWGAPFFAELFKNSVEIPSPTTEAIGEAARKANAYVVMGVNEREGGTLYNSLIYFNRAGRVMGKHRKLQPTHVERTVWGRGDGSDLVVCDTDIGRIGGLICWEHTMDLVRYAMIALGEQIHAAVWPAVSSLTHNPHASFFNNVTEAAARHHALAGQVFVINVQSVVDDYLIEGLGMTDRPDMIRPGGGWSAIIGPDGQIIAGPVTDKEATLFADINLEDIIYVKYACDSIGHYARPDVVSLLINREKQAVLVSRRVAVETLAPAAEEPAIRKQEAEKAAEAEPQGRRRSGRRPEA